MKQHKSEHRVTEFHKYFALLRKDKDEDKNRNKVPLRVISNATGISKPYLCSIGKNNVTPSEEIIKKLAAYFDVSPETFYLKLNILPDDEYKAALKLRKKISKDEFLKLVKEAE